MHHVAQTSVCCEETEVCATSSQLQGRQAEKREHEGHDPETNDDLRLLPAHHHAVEELGEEELVPRLGGDVFDQEHAARREEVTQALEDAALVLLRNVVHHVEDVDGVERAIRREGGGTDVTDVERVPEPELARNFAGEGDAARMLVKAAASFKPCWRRAHTRCAPDTVNADR